MMTEHPLLICRIRTKIMMVLGPVCEHGHAQAQPPESSGVDKYHCVHPTKASALTSCNAELGPDH